MIGARNDISGTFLRWVLVVLARLRRYDMERDWAEPVPSFHLAGESTLRNDFDEDVGRHLNRCGIQPSHAPPQVKLAALC